jgi:D-serine dehydratase
MTNVSDLRTRSARGLPVRDGWAFNDEPTTIDADAVEALQTVVIPHGSKGMPLSATGMTLAELAGTGWNVLGGKFPMPLMVLMHSALETNISAMAEYCRVNGVSLSPHGKTTMAPQLFRRQIEGGAWGMTAATPSHLRLYRRFGIDRIFYADQLVEPTVIEWLAAELTQSPSFDFYCLVDSTESVALLDQHLGALSRPVGVLVEVGYPGGRCGVRDVGTARDVAAAVDRSAVLQLRGVECFEGLLGDDGGVAPIDEFLRAVRAIAADVLETSSLRDRDEILITAGGSAYFDRVVDAFVNGWEHAAAARVVLRSGCYITQDGGFYGRTSPLGGRGAGAAVLRDGIEIWSAVLSRPEPGLAICSMGRRDAPQDMGMPVPIKTSSAGGAPTALGGASVVALSDQHAHLSLDPSCGLAPGDLVGCSISHPCTAFDRWRVIPVVDDAYVIRDAVSTFF